MAGDWNVSRAAIDTHPRLRTEEPHTRARSEFNARIAADGWIDIWRELYPQTRTYTWFNRRARGLDAARVDYILISEDLRERVESIEILEPLPGSDHAPVRLKLSAAGMACHDTEASPEWRLKRSLHPATCK